MTTFLLIRHAAVDSLGRSIAGRSPGVHLNEAGRAQAAALAERLRDRPIREIVSSPLERAIETARPIADRLGTDVTVAEELVELDFGEWTGKSIDELDTAPCWRRFNTHRGGTRIPGGETMLEAQARVVGLMQRLRDERPGETVALVSHGDVIRAAVLYHLGVPLDLFLRIDIAPASVSVVRLGEEGVQVAAINAFAAEW